MELSRLEASRSKFKRYSHEAKHPLTPSFYGAHLNPITDHGETQTYLKYSAEFIDNIKPYTPKPIEMGIVTCGGGLVYFTCAYIMIRMLRHLGCTLPVELWYLGSREMNKKMMEILAPYDVVCRDAYKLRKNVPARILNGWELKPYAIMNSNFNQVLFIDADNIPIVDPTKHFANEQYRKTGALFWPDQGILDVSRPIWSVCGVEYRREPEFETGQMVIDKKRCWRELNLTMHYNENSDYYYRFMHGDKETFHMAWRRLGTDYGMISHGLKRIDLNNNWVTFCQHDDEGKRVFQHRNTYKWSFAGHNPEIPDFKHENLCRIFLQDLRQIWDGIPYKVDEQPPEVLELEKCIRDKSLGIEYWYPNGNHKATAKFGSNGKVYDTWGFNANWVVEYDGITPTLQLMDGWHRTIAIFRPEDNKLVARNYRNEIRSIITLDSK